MPRAKHALSKVEERKARKGKRHMNIRGRSLADATDFLRALENSKVFQEVTLAVEEKKGSSAMGGEVEFSLSASYNPGGVAK